ncbi:VanW family protein [Paenibacillus harenae]|uniref:VanW family protein n=1 Tax=Paenibacillus harenae TaxID=306543 RepID=UPI002791538F|nr:VanW family protein [Paenibacillus harenae]MDQ0060334.1 vancomycin resistance protein YoaR [Paenibacillus harenae]
MLYNIALSILLLIQPAEALTAAVDADAVKDRQPSLTIQYKGQSLKEARSSEYTYPLPGVPIVNEPKLDGLMDEVDKRTYMPPVDATLDGGGGIIPERTGYRLDRSKFQEQFYGYIFEGGSSALEVPMKPVYPRVDSELMSSIRVKRIGLYTTYYNSRNKNRSHNIQLAAKAINNRVVFPNETFSFNETVGKRTEAKGYMRAPVIVRGEVSEGIGGGICQISSTLFNAADRAGLQIVNRYSHSRHVPYVPPGRDATVSWHGPDFVFKNKYNEPILIRAYAQNGTASIMIYSADTVNEKPREVPSASKKLPEEIKTEMKTVGR